MDTFYIKRCIEIAKKGQGNTYPNPMVGAVIVHNNKIIGEGYHKKTGESHAEINAIDSVKNKKLLKESTIYVSLEPCSHFGKTPPCALKLKEFGFKRVVIGTLDIYHKVNGKGIKILEEAGIEVSTNTLKQKCQNLNKRFFTFHEKKRPFIILKWAESNDGFLDCNFKTTKISNNLATQWVHQLRADEHAILIGKNTALRDNPTLTTRKIDGKNPVRILIDSCLEVPTNFNIYKKDGIPTFIFNTIKNEEKLNLKWIKINKENFLQNLLEKLYEHQIQSVIIEGGSFTLQQFIDSNLWDEAFIIKSPIILKNGTKAPKFSASAKEIKTLRDNQIFYFQNY